MSQDDIEITIDETRVKVQRRARPSYTDQEVLFVHVYDRLDDFGQDYSQYSFLITDEDDARTVRFMQQKGLDRPPQIAVDAVHEAGFQIEGLGERDQSQALLNAHNTLIDHTPDYEEFPVTANLLADAASFASWSAMTLTHILGDVPSDNRFIEAGVETEEDFFRYFYENPAEAQRFWDTFSESEEGNPMAVTMMRVEVMIAYGFDFLDQIEDAPDGMTMDEIMDQRDE